MFSLLVPRDITSREAAIIDWLLDNAAVRDVSTYRAKRISALRVVGGCGCGCSSLDFQADVPGTTEMLADALAVYPDKKRAGLILWGLNGDIDSLEVYEFDPVADRVPEIADLCRWKRVEPS